MAEPATSLRVLNEEIVACRKCARLVTYREEVARVKRRMFREWEYWGKAVPGFGDPWAQLFILGLAPAAHGANRTGRVFTGDRSGDFLYAALHKAGFANQPASLHGADVRPVSDGPFLVGVYHPSQQNTQTGKVTAPMYAKVLNRVVRILVEKQ